MPSLIRDTVPEFGPVTWAGGQLMTVELVPLALPDGRALGDFSGFTLTIREDPLWPRSGVSRVDADRADPIADSWPVAATSAGTVAAGVATFTFTMPAGSGTRRYAFDVWGALAAGGEVQLVRATWLTCGARVAAPPS